MQLRKLKLKPGVQQLSRPMQLACLASEVLPGQCLLKQCVFTMMPIAKAPSARGFLEPYFPELTSVWCKRHLT